MKTIGLVIAGLLLVGCERNRLNLSVLGAQDVGDLRIVAAGQSLADSEQTNPVWSETGSVDITRPITKEQYVPTETDPARTYTTWVTLGDLIAKNTGRKVHIFNRSWGGTSTQQWVENYNAILSNLLITIEREKPHAVLWMQGETDNILGGYAEDYYQNMRKIIHMSAARSPGTRWYVAIEAGNVADIEGSASVQGQRRLIREGLASEGVNVEYIRMDDSNRETPITGLHMSDKGNVVLAKEWFRVLWSAGQLHR